MKRFAFVLLLVSSPVLAEPYIGAGLTIVKYTEPGFPSFHPSAVTFRAGNEFNPNFAIEGRFGIGFTDYTQNISGTNFTLEVDQFFGVYARGILPLNPHFSVYGVVGFTDAELTFSIPEFSVSDSDSDFSYGVGIDLSIAPTIFINGEYMKLFDETDYYINTLSVGIVYKF